MSANIICWCVHSVLMMPTKSRTDPSETRTEHPVVVATPSRCRGSSCCPVVCLGAQVTEFGIELVSGLGGLLMRKLLVQLGPSVAVLFPCCCCVLSSCPRMARASGCGRCTLLIAFL
ncbi:hypothetical protein EDB86DRAFT_2957007 [Lactarius hatsudake]|nr:hypothetical protein EDB86DRAFT_2957007 [Lactarius hatsudake]